MIGANIRESLKRDPFVPFRLILSSVEHYDVRDRHSAALLKFEVFLVLPDGKRWALLPFLHIASIESLGNGRSRRGTRRKKR